MRPTFLSDRRRIERLYRSVEEFRWANELVKQIYYLGHPHFTDSDSSACLRVTGKGKPVFQFNRSFFDRLGSLELVFVLLHETLHLAFCHHLRCEHRSPVIWNLACDLVVNEFLLQRVGFEKMREPGFRKFIDSAVTFKNLPLGSTNTWLGLTAEQVYERLTKDLQGTINAAAGMVALDEHAWAKDSGQGTAQEELIEEFVEPGEVEPLDKDLPAAIKASEGIETPDEDALAPADDQQASQSELTQDLAEQVEQVFRQHIPAWSDHSLGEIRAISELLEPAGICWDVILANRMASCIQVAFEQRWAPVNRRIAWLYPEVLLPADQEIEKLQTSILMAIDASGSIPGSILDRFLSIARTIPRDRVELTAISFDEDVYPIDIWNEPPEIWGGGGTSFEAIEEFAGQLQRYPDLIVVLTDGYAPRPPVLHPNRWFWLITERGTSTYVEGIGRCCLIEDLRTGVTTK